jgi:hypothetical protein
MRRLIELNADLERRLAARGSKCIEPSPTLAIPILEAAVDETRAELKDLWERLLANAFDPSRTNAVRGSFIEILKKFDPMDARVFEAIAAQSGELSPNARDFVVGRLGNVSLDEVPTITNRGKLL